MGRSDDELTSWAGYAGGTKMATQGKYNNLVCYHNSNGIKDYGVLGHAEAVGMDIPSEIYFDFANVYIGLFDKNGDRPDKADVGPEYRHIVGLPGGMSSPLMQDLKEAANGLVSFKEGKGDDPDNLYKKLVYVYDTKSFPFHMAEVYH